MFSLYNPSVVSTSIGGLRRQWRKFAEKMARALIASRILVQVKLVIRFSIPPFSCREYFCCDLPILPPLLLNLLRDLLCFLLLLLVVVEDATAILCASIRPLLIQSCRIMHFVKEFNQLPIWDFFWVVDDLKGFGVASPSWANIPIAWAFGIATNVSNSCIDKTLVFECASVHMLDAPEAACGDSRLLGSFRHCHCGSFRPKSQSSRWEWSCKSRKKRAHEDNEDGRKDDQFRDRFRNWYCIKLIQTLVCGSETI